jgi:hypothetical protein
VVAVIARSSFRVSCFELQGRVTERRAYLASDMRRYQNTPIQRTFNQQPQKRRLPGTPIHDVQPSFCFMGLGHEHVTFPHVHDVHDVQELDGMDRVD